MRNFDQTPIWAAILIAALLVIGPTLALIGNLGLLRLRRFYERLHAPTLGTSWGTAATILASMLMFSLLEGRAVLHELVIGVFVMITTPVTLLLLGRAALRRDRARASPELDALALRAPAAAADTLPADDQTGDDQTSDDPAGNPAVDPAGDPPADPPGTPSIP